MPPFLENYRQNGSQLEVCVETRFRRRSYDDRSSFALDLLQDGKLVSHPIFDVSPIKFTRAMYPRCRQSAVAVDSGKTPCSLTCAYQGDVVRTAEKMAWSLKGSHLGATSGRHGTHYSSSRPGNNLVKCRLTVHSTAAMDTQLSHGFHRRSLCELLP